MKCKKRAGNNLEGGGLESRIISPGDLYPPCPSSKHGLVTLLQFPASKSRTISWSSNYAAPTLFFHAPK